MTKVLMVFVALFGLALAYPGGYGGGGHGNANYGPHAGYGEVHNFGYGGSHSPHDDCDGTHGHGNHHDSFGTHNAGAHAHYTKPGVPHDIGFDDPHHGGFEHGHGGAHHGGYGHQSASAGLETHHSHHGTHHPGGF